MNFDPGQFMPADGAWRVISLSKPTGADVPIALHAYRLDGQGPVIDVPDVRAQPVEKTCEN